jgi:hypothetical protein
MRLEHLSVRYGANAAVKDVSLSIRQGEVLAAVLAVWNRNPLRTERAARYAAAARAAGVLALVVAVVTYRRADGGWLRPEWWGILGLIGWVSLPVAAVSVAARGSPSRSPRPAGASISASASAAPSVRPSPRSAPALPHTIQRGSVSWSPSTSSTT